MKSWIVFSILCAMCKGIYECSKKKAIEENSIYEVLAWFSLISFLLLALTTKIVWKIELVYIFFILIKSLFVVGSWILGMYALKRMSISLYSIFSLLKIVFSVILGIVFLGEEITITTLIGIIIVLFGMFLVNNISNNKEKKDVSLKIILILILSCLFAAISGFIDKKILVYVTNKQLQFWFLLFLSVIYWGILIVRNKGIKKIKIGNIDKNYWIPIMALFFVVGDKFWFMSNEDPFSKLTLMTIINQSAIIEIIILGKFFFKEDKIIKKLLCSILIIFGVVLALM